ncbi:MAG: DUF1385 domain-containing protein, partial [Thermoleophilaceae bacterium]|nr:DUF1385 domain-containing protein [Thermoleophilaceae bacterium]
LSNKVDGMPGVRGVVRMGEAMAVLPLVRMHMPEARFAFERLSVLGTVIATSTAAMAVKRFGGKRSSTDFAVSLLGLVPAIVSLRSGNVAEYHGAEHKAIAAYEVDGDAADQSKEHDRCGSHLMAPMMLSSLAGDALLRNVFKNESAAAQAGVALAGVASSVEMFAWADRHPKSAFARLFHKPGHELQRVMGTREPTREQLDVAEAAIAELLRAEGHSS